MLTSGTATVLPALQNYWAVRYKYHLRRIRAASSHAALHAAAKSGILRSPTHNLATAYADRHLERQFSEAEDG
jgi:hypothetical protein